MRKARVTATLGATILAFLTVTSPSASAASDVTLRTSHRGTDGYAVSTGSVTWLSRTSLRVDATATDRCGTGRGDGEGAYVWLTIEYMNETVDNRLSLNWDNDGCDNGSRGNQVATFRPGVPIKRVRIRLDEANGPSRPSETVYSAWKDNPRT